MKVKCQILIFGVLFSGWGSLHDIDIILVYNDVKNEYN